jgi:hypothetical protein
MRNILIATALAITLAGCTKQAAGIAQTDNAHFEVERLFETDGCKVFRFEDNGRDHYFAHCGVEANVNTQQSCGKNCSYPEDTTSN